MKFDVPKPHKNQQIEMIFDGKVEKLLTLSTQKSTFDAGEGRKCEIGKAKIIEVSIG